MPSPSGTTRSIDAVIFDLGGVLSANGRPSDFASRFPHVDHELVLRVIMGDYGTDGDHSWHRLERGEISLDEHRTSVRAALDEHGIEFPTPTPGAATTMRFEPNEPVVGLVQELRAAGLRLGVLTNNVAEFRPLWREMLPFDEWFDDVVDSHEVGMRKPNPAIYRLALERLGAVAERTAFLDDVATNVAAADAVGMIGVLVEVDPEPAVQRVLHLAGLR
jgi:epoxide hydrolase-like predicted phosphatase